MIVIKFAARSPADTEPLNSQFLRPVATRFSLVFGKIDGSFITRQVFGELAVVFARSSRLPLALLLLGVFDDLFGLADRFFERTDDFGRDLLTQVQQ